ncbi:mCG13778, partial [Mus musculus]
PDSRSCDIPRHHSGAGLEAGPSAGREDFPHLLPLNHPSGKHPEILFSVPRSKIAWQLFSDTLSGELLKDWCYLLHRGLGSLFTPQIGNVCFWSQL